MSRFTRRQFDHYKHSEPLVRAKILFMDIFSHLVERSVADPVARKLVLKSLPQYVRVKSLNESVRLGEPVRSRVALDAINSALQELDKWNDPLLADVCSNMKQLLPPMRENILRDDPALQNYIMLGPTVSKMLVGISTERIGQIIGKRKFQSITKAAFLSIKRVCTKKIKKEKGAAEN